MLGIGLFRLILALTVVITHTHSIWGFTLGNPVIAVRTFFIISGFYMTLILNEKYKEVRAFWVNRFLKIFPIYWFVLVLTVLSCIGAFWLRGNWGEMHYLVNNLGDVSLGDKLVILISQLTIIGREVVMFGNYSGQSGQVFLLIPQAWTLVLELWFYILAPFVLVRKWYAVIALAGLSLVVRITLEKNGLNDTLWTYRFFPTELIYFLMGYGSYRIYKLVKSYQLKVTSYLGIVFLIIVVLALSTFNFWPGSIFRNEWYFYILMMVLIPFIFFSSKNSVLDRKIGDLSYPVYITHILVNNVVNPLLLLPLATNRNWQAIIVMMGSIGLSVLINKFIQAPVEKIREVRIK